MPAHSATLALAGVALLASACGGKPRQLGEPLGTYHVVGRVGPSSCGEGALGAADPWEFDVKLSRSGDTLYWENGSEPVEGQVAADGTFTLAQDTVVPIHDKQAAMGACAIGRHDEAKGLLAGSPDDVPSFTGTLTYAFSPTAADDCRDVVGDEPGMLAALPCAVAYQLDATRTAR